MIASGEENITKFASAIPRIFPVYWYTSSQWYHPGQRNQYNARVNFFNWIIAHEAYPLVVVRVVLWRL